MFVHCSFVRGVPLRRILYVFKVCAYIGIQLMFFFVARMEFLENIGGMEMSSCGNVLTVAAGRKVFFLDAHT